MTLALFSQPGSQIISEGSYDTEDDLMIQHRNTLHFNWMPLVPHYIRWP